MTQIDLVGVIHEVESYWPIKQIVDGIDLCGQHNIAVEANGSFSNGTLTTQEMRVNPFLDMVARMLPRSEYSVINTSQEKTSMLALKFGYLLVENAASGRHAGAALIKAFESYESKREKLMAEKIEEIIKGSNKSLLVIIGALHVPVVAKGLIAVGLKNINVHYALSDGLIELVEEGERVRPGHTRAPFNRRDYRDWSSRIVSATSAYREDLATHARQKADDERRLRLAMNPATAHLAQI